MTVQTGKLDGALCDEFIKTRVRDFVHIYIDFRYAGVSTVQFRCGSVLWEPYILKFSQVAPPSYPSWSSTPSLPRIQALTSSSEYSALELSEYLLHTVWSKSPSS